METNKRTATCGQLRAADAGRPVTLNGWVHRKRDHGGVTFINLRDRYGVTQVVVDSEASEALKQAAAGLKSEYCVAVEGVVRERPAAMRNPAMPTGDVELAARRIVVLNKCEPLPFQVDDAVRDSAHDIPSSRQTAPKGTYDAVRDSAHDIPSSRQTAPKGTYDEAEAKGGKGEVKEELRLAYRYLDLRRAEMQRKIRLRNDVTFAVREWLEGEGFLEIETPTLIKTTPEGARDYLVPSRLYPGNFYALPQSPQLYKQILMVSGFDRYFQIARCYRDEDARGDRQPEFTQIDIEMSFVGRDDVLKTTEGLMRHVFKKTLGVELATPFPRLTWEEAQERYGTDKPDLRFGLCLRDFAPFAAKAGFQAFKDALSAGGAVKALVVPGQAAYSRKQIEELEAHAKVYKAKGLGWFKVTGGRESANGNGVADGSRLPTLEGGLAKFFADQAADISAALDAKPGDLVLVCADAKRQVANTALGAVRTKLGRDLGLTRGALRGAEPPAEGVAEKTGRGVSLSCPGPGSERGGGFPPHDSTAPFAFCWIVDFPLFEYNEEEKRWEAAHHMFSYPQEKYHDTLESDPGSVKGDLYDLVLNGFELASGSIRIHDPELQKRIFNIVGFDPADAEAKFGFLTTAFKYGAPPHGGIAPGLDRLVMLMAGETSIREVIAFPKNSFAQGLMDGSPSPADEKQLTELRLRVVKD